MSDGTSGRCHRRKYPSQEKSAVNTPYQENAQTLSSDQLTLSQFSQPQCMYRTLSHVHVHLCGMNSCNKAGTLQQSPSF